MKIVGIRKYEGQKNGQSYNFNMVCVKANQNDKVIGEWYEFYTLSNDIPLTAVKIGQDVEFSVYATSNGRKYITKIFNI